MRFQLVLVPRASDKRLCLCVYNYNKLIALFPNQSKKNSRNI